MKMKLYKNMEICFNEKSNNYIDISPIYDENENYQNTGFIWANDPYEGLCLSKTNSFQKEINYNLIQELKEKEFLEKKFIKKFEEIQENSKDENQDCFKDNIFSYLNIESRPLPVPEALKINEEKDHTNKSTEDKSKSTNNAINKCIFGIKFGKSIEPRMDYCIKNFKVYMIKFLKEHGNELIKKCGFQNRLKKIKLFSPSYKYFTGNSNIKDNKIFLNLTMEKIFSYPEGKVEKNDNRLQRQNKDIIKDFKDCIEEEYPEKVPEKCQELLNFFNMTFQDAIRLFYESNQFKNYSSSPKTKFLDKQFMKAKGFSLLEKNAFFKLLKNYNV